MELKIMLLCKLFKSSYGGGVAWKYPAQLVYILQYMNRNSYSLHFEKKIIVLALYFDIYFYSM